MRDVVIINWIADAYGGQHGAHSENAVIAAIHSCSKE